MASIQLGADVFTQAAQQPAPIPEVNALPFSLAGRRTRAFGLDLVFFVREAKMENAATVVATKDCCRGVLSCASVSFPCLLKLHDSTHASLPQGFWL